MTLLSLNSYYSLFLKCETELELLKSTKSHPEYDYILLNIVIGLNHLFEWVLKDEIDISIKFDCVKGFNPFSDINRVSSDFLNFYKQLSTFPKTDGYQEIIRALCNKAKHFNQKPIEKQNKNFTSVCGAANMTCGNPEAVCGAFDHYLYSVDINGEEHQLEILLETQINKWSKFLKNVKQLLPDNAHPVRG